eukprot:NODE_4581_length_461_cov_90.300971_g3953_i0.p3 GENE.NODE_4581_length_461_cov_90.300971_g3953_i0~~NODE_4581_length_461_cov_90.300971_g3953_i0.p3  ORF type:complete len:50 (-),score=10.88 NODE_4581_length_461_cov_90.300971_g3953_i0:4-153(-)
MPIDVCRKIGVVLIRGLALWLEFVILLPHQSFVERKKIDTQKVSPCTLR